MERKLAKCHGNGMRRLRGVANSTFFSKSKRAGTMSKMIESKIQKPHTYLHSRARKSENLKKKWMRRLG